MQFGYERMKANEKKRICDTRAEYLLFLTKAKQPDEGGNSVP
jgi:hypothetical protein